MQTKTILVVLGVIFNSEGKILITKRNEPEDPTSHNKWQLPGGGIEFGEHPKQTLIRELKEETGFHVSLLSQNPLVYSETGSDAVHFLFFMYPCLVKNGALDLSLDPETSEAVWATLEEIKEKECLSHTYEIAKDANIFFKE